MEDNQLRRLSFSKDKIENFSVGNSGITGTSNSSKNVSSLPDANMVGDEVSYNSSALLFKNLDNLSILLSKNNKQLEPEDDVNLVDNQEQEIEEMDWTKDDSYENLTEEELIKNLNQYLNYEKREVVNKTQPIKKDNFCRKCGQDFLSLDNFCGGCGNKRN